MKKLLILLALTVPVFANPAVFKSYESVRQALLKNSLKDVQKSALALAKDAEKAKLRTIAEFAQSVSIAKNLDDARRSFGALSDEMIKLPGRPPVYYCDMARKSWLQPKGKVGNPYEPAMPTCGTLKSD